MGTFCVGADPYVIIYCEGQSVKSVIRKDTLEPEFETMAIFYRKKPRKHLTIQVRWWKLLTIQVRWWKHLTVQVRWGWAGRSSGWGG